jgi:hypothetical protein
VHKVAKTKAIDYDATLIKSDFDCVSYTLLSEYSLVIYNGRHGRFQAPLSLNSSSRLFLDRHADFRSGIAQQKQMLILGNFYRRRPEIMELHQPDSRNFI